MSKTYRVSLYNTFSKQYEEVFLNHKLYTEYIRNEWRLEKSEQRERRRTIPLSALQNDEKDDVERTYLADESNNPLDLVIQRETITRLHNALIMLEEAERRIITEIYIHGKTECELAKKLNRPQRTINYKKSAALIKLKKILK